ncbi:hypothetical protein MFIFM68171_01727 [Madurella fahalii]|uniref:Rhodopsin domain-containing protein n=1 Tax=Madurella fahalii TaxID=1157608 RepID=A0ABQ0G199_9PEZI
MSETTATPADPGYVVGESRSESLIIIVTCMMTLSTVVLLLRILARARVQGVSSGADEWTILASWAFSIAFTVNVCVQTKHGLGKHVGDLPRTTNFAAALELFYYGEATYYITVSLTKMSILFLYLKIIPQRGYRIFNWIMMAFVFLTGLTCVVAGIFQCNPIHKAWHTEVPGTCFNQVALYLSNAGLNIFQDLIIYFLPVPTLWKLQLPRKQRIALIAVFIIGAFVCLTGILRLESLTMASVSKDPTWDNYGAAIWSSIESNVGIVCASLVHLKPLIVRYAPSMLGIQRTTRLPDERSDPTGNNDLRTFGQSSNKSKPFGILTEIELEETIEPKVARSTAYTSDNPSDNDSDGFTGPQASGIHKTTRVSISYGDQESARGF